MIFELTFSCLFSTMFFIEGFFCNTPINRNKGFGAGNSNRGSFSRLHIINVCTIAILFFLIIIGFPLFAFQGTLMTLLENNGVNILICIFYIVSLNLLYAIFFSAGQQVKILAKEKFHLNVKSPNKVSKPVDVLYALYNEILEKDL